MCCIKKLPTYAFKLYRIVTNPHYTTSVLTFTITHLPHRSKPRPIAPRGPFPPNYLFFATPLNYTDDICARFPAKNALDSPSDICIDATYHVTVSFSASVARFCD